MKLRNLPQGVEILQIGKKLLTATCRGIKLLQHRLLEGKQEDLDTYMGELIRAKVAIGDARPLIGSREQYMLVDRGKWQINEVPDQQTEEEMQADWWTFSP